MAELTKLLLKLNNGEFVLNCMITKRVVFTVNHQVDLNSKINPNYTLELTEKKYFYIFIAQQNMF